VHQVVTQVTATDWPSFVEKSALRADSFLTRLSDNDFQQGMAALRTHGDAINQDDAVTEEIDWCVFTRRMRSPVLPRSRQVNKLAVPPFPQLQQPSEYRLRAVT
jgi:hypothetical protein